MRVARACSTGLLFILLVLNRERSNGGWLIGCKQRCRVNLNASPPVLSKEKRINSIDFLIVFQE